MKDNRAELYHQAKKLCEYIEENLYSDSLTNKKAERALVMIHQTWIVLERRAK